MSLLFIKDNWSPGYFQLYNITIIQPFLTYKNKNFMWLHVAGWLYLKLSFGLSMLSRAFQGPEGSQGLGPCCCIYPRGALGVGASSYSNRRVCTSHECDSLAVNSGWSTEYLNCNQEAQSLTPQRYNAGSCTWRCNCEDQMIFHGVKYCWKWSQNKELIYTNLHSKKREQGSPDTPERQQDQTVMWHQWVFYCTPHLPSSLQSFSCPSLQPTDYLYSKEGAWISSRREDDTIFSYSIMNTFHFKMINLMQAMTSPSTPRKYV